MFPGHWLIERGIYARGWTSSETFTPRPPLKDAQLALVQSRRQRVCVGEKDELLEGDIRHEAWSTRAAQGSSRWRSGVAQRW